MGTWLRRGALKDKGGIKELRKNYYKVRHKVIGRLPSLVRNAENPDKNCRFITNLLYLLLLVPINGMNVFIILELSPSMLLAGGGVAVSPGHIWVCCFTASRSTYGLRTKAATKENRWRLIKKRRQHRLLLQSHGHLWSVSADSESDHLQWWEHEELFLNLFLANLLATGSTFLLSETKIADKYTFIFFC